MWVRAYMVVAQQPDCAELCGFGRFFDFLGRRTGHRTTRNRSKAPKIVRISARRRYPVEVQLSDSQLLADFVRAQDQRAFAALVQRHINLVYSAALRRTRDSHLADDITQAVFLILAKKAASLTPQVVLSAWLHRTTRYAAMDAIKLRGRRMKHEQKAAEMRPSQYDPEMEMKWPRASELLDEALDCLGETDRRAVMLRYYENKSFAEVGAALGVAEEAARKRVSRAAEKMRTWMGRRGSVVTGALLATMLETRIAEAAAPKSLIENVLASAATPQSAVAIADQSLSHIWWDQARRVALYVFAAAVIAIATGFVVHSWMHYEPPPPRAVEHSTQ